MNTLKLSMVTLATALVVGCGGGSGGGNDAGAAANVENAVYTVSVTNLTQSQPMSPPAIVMHTSEYSAFADTFPATFGLEVLAEGGSPADLLVEAQASTGHIASVSADQVQPIAPRMIGVDNTVTIPLDNADDVRLTVLTMLIDTNDAFTGTNGVDVSNMVVGSTRTFNVPTWDAGTEANTETADTMPGPAATDAGGLAEGFNPVRDDNIQGVVHFHQGVVTSANSNDPSREGLSTSILQEIDRWENPASRIVVTRTQ